MTMNNINAARSEDGSIALFKTFVLFLFFIIIESWLLTREIMMY